MSDDEIVDSDDDSPKPAFHILHERAPPAENKEASSADEHQHVKKRSRKITSDEEEDTPSMQEASTAANAPAVPPFAATAPAVATAPSPTIAASLPQPALAVAPAAPQLPAAAPALPQSTNSQARLSTMGFQAVKRSQAAAAPPGRLGEGMGLKLRLELFPNGITDAIGSVENSGVREMLLKPLGFQPLGKAYESTRVGDTTIGRRWRHDLSTPPPAWPRDPLEELQKRCKRDGIECVVADFRGKIARKPKVSMREMFVAAGGVLPPAQPQPPPTQPQPPLASSSPHPLSSHPPPPTYTSPHRPAPYAPPPPSGAAGANVNPSRTSAYDADCLPDDVLLGLLDTTTPASAAPAAPPRANLAAGASSSSSHRSSSSTSSSSTSSSSVALATPTAAGAVPRQPGSYAAALPPQAQAALPRPSDCAAWQPQPPPQQQPQQPQQPQQQQGGLDDWNLPDDVLLAAINAGNL